MSLDMVSADALQHLLFFWINAPVSFGHQDQYTEHRLRCCWFRQGHQSRVKQPDCPRVEKTSIDRNVLDAWRPAMQSPGEG